MLFVKAKNLMVIYLIKTNKKLHDLFFLKQIKNKLKKVSWNDCFHLFPV